MSQVSLDNLDFATLRDASSRRCAEFHKIDEWSNSDWGNAMAGEFGEVAQDLLELNQLVLEFFSRLKACDTIKKMMRQFEGDAKYSTLKARLAKEIADVVLYSDLLSAKLDIDLGAVVREKFNEVSVKRGSAIKL